MTASPLAEDLQHYLRQARASVLRALEDLPEYDVRRPLVPSGSNLLGMVKHLTGIEAGYLGDCVGRPLLDELPWFADGSVWDAADMWARPDETREHLVGLYRRSCAHADTSIDELPLDTPAQVAWWPEERRSTTFGHLLVRVVAETAQHAGHCDVLRETVDGRGGADADARGDAAFWDRWHATIQQAADPFRT